MNNTITTNDRFDRLTNLDIRTHYADIIIYANMSDFLGAFAYWVTAQNPNNQLLDILPSLTAFERYISGAFDHITLPEKFDTVRLRKYINETSFERIPEIDDLNNLTPDFIDLGALARNVYYMILREYITQNLESIKVPYIYTWGG